MKTPWVLLFIALFYPSVAWVGASSEGDERDTVSATELVYGVNEPGVAPYADRMLVTPAHLRIDQGDAGDGFLLFDRRSGAIYSISEEEKAVLILQPRPVAPALPEGLQLTEQKTEQVDAPPIGGLQPVEYGFFANGELCRSAVVVPGLLEEARRALREYERVLAFQQVASLANTPKEMQTPCDLATYVHAPGREFAHGLPINVWDPSGHARRLIDFATDRELPAAWFELPPDYPQQTLSELMGDGLSR